MNFFEYNQNFLKQAKKKNFSFKKFSNGAVAVWGGKGIKICVFSGLHGDEKSGPLGILKWISQENLKVKNSFLVIPLINNQGWDKNNRFCRGKDLNRHFGKKKILFIEEIAAVCNKFKPDIFLDFHEDNQPEDYFYRFKGENSFLYNLLKERAKLSEKKWFSFKKWNGSSEVFIRSFGCKNAATIEFSVRNKKRKNARFVEKILNYLITESVLLKKFG